MEQRDRTAPQPRDPVKAPPPVAEGAETVLKMAVDIYGPAVLDQPDKLQRYLEDQCPTAASDNALLLSALAEGVPQTLMRVTSGEGLRRLVPRLEQALIERQGLNPLGAAWAVATWATVLRMDSEGLARSLDATAPRPGVADRGEAPAAPAAVGSGNEVPVDPPTSTMRTIEPAGIEPVAAPPVEHGPVATQPTREAPAPRVSGTASPPAATAPAIVVEPHGGAAVVEPVVVEPIVAAPTVVEPASEPALVRFIEPPPPPDRPAMREAHPPVAPTPPTAADDPVEPSPIAEAFAAVVAEPAPVDPVGIVADAEASSAAIPVAPGEATPAWASPRQPPRGTRPRAHGWLRVTGVLVAAVVGVLAVRFFATSGTSEPQRVERPAPPVVASTVPLASKPTTKAAAPAVPAATGIVDVTSDEPLVGDGTQHDVFVAIDPRRDDVRWITVQFLGGDGAWDPKPRVVDVASEDLRKGRVPAGTIGLRTTRPATATFQYALTTADGRQTAPFTRRFTFTPVAARPPAIAYVAAPADLAVGRPFAVTIDYRVGDAKLASVERKMLDPRTGAEGAVTVTPVDSLATPKPGRLSYPVDAIDSTSRRTMAFTLVDEDGLRSDARRIVLDVVAPAAAAHAMRARGPTAVRPCTRETCGSVVSVRATGGTSSRTKTFDIIVRLDDRSIRSFVVQGTWKVGHRVHVTGDRVAAVGAVASSAPTKAPAVPPARLLPESVPIIDQ